MRTQSTDPYESYYWKILATSVESGTNRYLRGQNLTSANHAALKQIRNLLQGAITADRSVSEASLQTRSHPSDEKSLAFLSAVVQSSHTIFNSPDDIRQFLDQLSRTTMSLLRGQVVPTADVELLQIFAVNFGRGYNHVLSWDDSGTEHPKIHWPTLIQRAFS